MRKALPLWTAKAGPFLWAALGLLLLGSLPAAAAAEEIDPERLRQHVAVLASDAFQGREAGGPAERKTTDYIVAALKRAGVGPGWNGRWLQRVPLVRRSAMASRLFYRTGENAPSELPPEALALIGDEAVARIRNAPVVFAGYGIVDPATGRDDLAGADLRGAVVLRLGGTPPGYDKPGMLAPDLTARRAMYLERGAIAEIAINDIDDAGFLRIKAGYRHGTVKLADDAALPVTGQVMLRAVQPMLLAAGLSYDDLKAQAARTDFRAMPLNLRLTGDVMTALRRFRSANVVGRLNGRDLAQEAVILTAHWDAYGVCLLRGHADRICNGAIDNASGVAGLIELAAALAKGDPPRRSILFIATTAEEHGLLGAEHYARDPAVPLGDTVGGINFDTIALRGRGARPAVIGRGLTTLDPIIRDAADAQGRPLLDDPLVHQYYRRSDHYALARRGVPMVMVTNLFARETAKDDPVDRYFADRYHQPEDEIEAIPSFDGAAEDVDLALAIIRRIANDPARPQWLADSPYQRHEAR